MDKLSEESLTLIERLEHFEQHQLENDDEYGAEVLHHTRKRIAQLEEELEKSKEKKIRCPHCARFYFLTPEGRKLIESLEVNEDFIKALKAGGE